MTPKHSATRAEIATRYPKSEGVAAMTTEDTRYNGWNNYETWNVALWINNDQGAQEAVNEAAMDALNDADGDVEDATDRLASVLDDMHSAQVSELNVYGTFADMLNASLRVVDWSEIAATFITENLAEWTDNQ